MPVIVKELRLGGEAGNNSSADDRGAYTVPLSAAELLRFLWGRTCAQQKAVEKKIDNSNIWKYNIRSS